MTAIGRGAVAIDDKRHASDAIAGAAMNGEFFAVVEVESRVVGMSVRDRQGAEVLIEVPRPDCCIELARRGLYGYDRTDMARGCRQIDACELLAIPAIRTAKTNRQLDGCILAMAACRHEMHPGGCLS